VSNCSWKSVKNFPQSQQPRAHLSYTRFPSCSCCSSMDSATPAPCRPCRLLSTYKGSWSFLELLFHASAITSPFSPFSLLSPRPHSHHCRRSVELAVGHPCRPSFLPAEHSSTVAKPPRSSSAGPFLLSGSPSRPRRSTIAVAARRRGAPGSKQLVVD
jgi:hypothetical protein